MNYVLLIVLAVCMGAIAFFVCVLLALCRDKRDAFNSRKRSADSVRQLLHFEPASEEGHGERNGRNWWAPVIVLCMCSLSLRAQSAPESSPTAPAETVQAMQARIDKLEGEVSELKALVLRLQPDSQKLPSDSLRPAGNPQSSPAEGQQQLLKPEDRQTLDFLHDTTINVGLDAYYAYNFNHPVGRVNLLRAYDVLSNEFSLNQASVIVDHPPDLAAGRRWGGRLDLQFGQATDTLQGNPANEPRPQIYRNIFQVYGTYVVPVGKGVTVDFGKWGSSLGIEGNYTKDQMNYSRSYWFDFLPFYHMGLRANIPVNDRFSVNYWVVNGVNQVEAANAFKGELFGFTAKPLKSMSWTVNYYLGQDHPDRVLSASPTNVVPVQPGLNFEAIRPAPDGRTHIIDSYATWQLTSKLSMALEGDYFLQRLWRDSAPGQSSAPLKVDGACGYLRYQFTPKLALATRAEYMSDRGALFSGISQALKENTVTLDYKLADGLLTRYEWRRDFSNQPSFLSDVQGVLSKQQNTATIGLILWWGRKEGSW